MESQLLATLADPRLLEIAACLIGIVILRRALARPTPQRHHR